MGISYTQGDALAEMDAQADQLEARRYVQWVGCIGVSSGNSITIKEVGGNQGLLGHFVATGNDFKDRVPVMR